MEKNDSLVLATQFSRLRPGTQDAAGDVDLRYEAMTAFSEALDLLAEALAAKADGRAWDSARRVRLEERVAELGRRAGSKSKAGGD